MSIILLVYKIMCICSRAIYSGVEPAMQWVLEHMADPGVYMLYNVMY